MKTPRCFICGIPFWVSTYGDMIDVCNECEDDMNDGTFTVYKKVQIHTAHILPGHSSCGEMHGHSMDIVVGVRGKLDLATGMVIDFKELKRIMQEEIIDPFDHKCLNNVIPMPTAEYLAFYIYHRINARNINVVEVRVHESDNNYAKYKSR